MDMYLSRRRFFATTSAIGLPCCLTHRASGDSIDSTAAAAGTAAHEPTYTDAKTFDWRFGMSLRTSVTFTGGLGTFSIPMDWPEQSVQIVSRDVGSQVTHLQFRDLNDSVRQVLLGMPRVTSNQSVDVMLEIRIEKRDIIAPADPSSGGGKPQELP